MQDDPLTTIQVRNSVRNRLRVLAEQDLRTLSAELEWLVEREETRRVLPVANIRIAQVSETQE